MNIISVIRILSIVTWVFPPFKQYKSKFFYFFLILALAGPFVIISSYLLHINSILLSTMVSFLSIVSLSFHSKQRYFFAVLIILSTIILLSFSLHRNIIILSLIGTHLIFVLILVLYIMRHILETRAINLFLILLVTYELINITKFMAGLLSYNQGAISFYLATFAQIFFGISFSFISIRTKDFPIHIKE